MCTISFPVLPNYLESVRLNIGFPVVRTDGRSGAWSRDYFNEWLCIWYNRQLKFSRFLNESTRINRSTSEGQTFSNRTINSLYSKYCGRTPRKTGEQLLNQDGSFVQSSLWKIKWAKRSFFICFKLSSAFFQCPIHDYQLCQVWKESGQFILFWGITLVYVNPNYCLARLI